MDWMTEVEQTLDTHTEIAVTQEEIKQQLSDLKVHQICPSGVNRSESIGVNPWGGVGFGCSSLEIFKNHTVK